jgi:hypothetical protein
VPEVIVEFLASKNQPISALRFSADGSALVVVPGDGQTVKVFQVRPLPRTLRFVGREVEQLDEGQNASTIAVGAFGWKGPDANCSKGEHPLAYV